MERILLDHGSGGEMTHDLISDVFLSAFSDDVLNKRDDAAILPGQIAFTTDAFVITPPFFPGGDIGKLAVCGTVNDLVVSGARPKFLTCSFIIEEGFSLTDLRRVVLSMAHEARAAGVRIVAGDTKVVKKGEADGLFISMSGIGEVIVELGLEKVEVGDAVIITGAIAEHGFAILATRAGIMTETPIKSDCASLNRMLEDVALGVTGIKFMRDPTRGGLAAVLNEIVNGRTIGIELDESKVPVSEPVRAVSELLGIETYGVASEGRAVIVADSTKAVDIVNRLRTHELGSDACIIGRVTSDNAGKVIAVVSGGGRRVIAMPAGEGLPRIC